MALTSEAMKRTVNELHQSVDDFNNACRVLQADGLLVDPKFLGLQSIGEQFERQHLSVAVFKRVDL